MANHKAIMTVCETVIHLLRTSNKPGELNGHTIDFKVSLPKSFNQSHLAGVYLSLYRISPNGSHRMPGGRLLPDGKRDKTQLPIDLHFLLTVWGNDAAMQHLIAGWMMRTLEDTPILPSNILNTVGPNVFKPDETVEITFVELSNEDVFRIWEKLTESPESRYQISVPYIARNVRIESGQAAAIEPVQDRVF